MYFCPKCGKFYDYEIAECKECKTRGKTHPSPLNADVSGACLPIAQNPRNRMFGFGKAITGFALGLVADLLVYIAACLSPTAAFGDDFLILGLIILFCSLPFIIASIVLGIGAINSFKKRKAARCAKNVPTLVVGILSLLLGAGSLICAVTVLIFIVLMALLGENLAIYF